jgi:hypothetical protein
LSRRNIDRRIRSGIVDRNGLELHVQLIGNEDIVGLIEIDDRQDAIAFGYERLESAEYPRRAASTRDGRHGFVVQGTTQRQVFDGRGGHDASLYSDVSVKRESDGGNESPPSVSGIVRPLGEREAAAPACEVDVAGVARVAGSLREGVVRLDRHRAARELRSVADVGKRCHRLAVRLAGAVGLVVLTATNSRQSCAIEVDAGRQVFDCQSGVHDVFSLIKVEWID